MTFTGDPLFAASLAFRGWFPWWAALVLGLLATAGVIALYATESGRLPVWRRVVMAGLRVVLIASVLSLALRPTLLTETRGTRPRPVAVLVDDSQSMTAADPRPNFADRWRTALAFNRLPPDRPMPDGTSSGDLPADVPERPTRIQIARAVLENPRLKLLENLTAIGPLQPSYFGVTRSAKDPRDPKWPGALSGREPRTALADGIFDILKRDENELPAAVVLVTDGRENASQRGLEELARECARLGLPLHIYGVGSSSVGQVQIREAIVPETLFVDDTVSIPVRFRVRGYREGRAELVVKLDGEEVARKLIDLTEGDDLKETLSFVPTLENAQAGKQELTTTLRIVSGPEMATDELTKSVRVVDRKLKVLVVESIPRFDYKFLQRALLRDRRVEASFLLTEGDRRAMESGPPFIPRFPATRQELLAFDLLILGDIPAGFLNPEQQQFVREFVAEGGGLIHLAGRNHGPASFVGTPLAEVLPVEFEPVHFPVDSGTSPEGYRPEPTPVGVRNLLLSLADDPTESLRVWRTLPEFFWHYPVTRTKPAIDVFLTHPTQTTADNKPMPLLAGHYYGKGYVLYCGFDETWRWRYNEAERFFGRFWSQAVYVTGVPRTLGTKLTQLSLDTPDPLLGRTGQVYARLLTPELRPVVSEEVEATLERLDAGPDERTSRIRLRKLPGQGGDFVAPIPFNQAGRFALTVDNGGNPGTLEYRVTLPTDHELAPGGMAEDELRKLAQGTGGGFYREEDLHRLPGSIEPKRVPYTQRNEILLWNEWAFLWVLALFTAEWFLRKFNSLS